MGRWGDTVRKWGRRPRRAGVAVAVVLVAGCSPDAPTATPPRACTLGPGAVQRALDAAPGAVRLERTPLSRCLTRRSDPADIQAVGSTYLAVAGDLAERARAEPEGAAALRLGYLIAAARRGASGTQGIHTEMLRRLEQELTIVDTGSAAFRRGERAGRLTG